MKLITGTESELETIEQEIASAIGSGSSYISKSNWFKKKTDETTYGMSYDMYFHEQIKSVIGQEGIDNMITVDTSNAEWFDQKPPKTKSE